MLEVGTTKRGGLTAAPFDARPEEARYWSVKGKASSSTIAPSWYCQTPM
jgi:hypothetical protein